jgi:hypothetical protein
MAKDTARAILPLIIGNIICDENIGTENKRNEVLMNIGENSISFCMFQKISTKIDFKNQFL